MVKFNIEGELLRVSTNSFTDKQGKKVEYAIGTILTDEEILDISIPKDLIEEVEKKKRVKGVWEVKLLPKSGTTYRLSF